MPALSKLTLEPGKSYHILNRGNNRRTIFDVDRDYLRFLDLLEKYILPIAKIQAYALLSNHFHLAVAIREESELEEFYLEKPARIIRRFGHLQNAYAKYFIHRNDLVSGLFERSFERYLIDSDEYCKKLIVYLHMNPVNHGVSSSISSYEWTSYPGLIGDSQSKILDKEGVYRLFGGRQSFIFAHNGWDELPAFPSEIGIS